jgi:hypothetical protein
MGMVLSIEMSGNIRVSLMSTIKPRMSRIGNEVLLTADGAANDHGATENDR